ncbi:hypothetical protein ACFPZI_00335 [Streptomyces chlorus]|uniref:Uncharacterized protein n=1 Tax=Streptomyces chlorus TaxID=887452 RepID=A0ABW1DRP5_9ACTN
MGVQSSTLHGVRIVESTSTHVGWTLLRLASYIAFPCGQLC